MKTADITLHINAVALLRAEYTSIWKLCESYRASLDNTTSADRTKLAMDLSHRVSLCNLVEQDVLYPEVRKVNEEVVVDLLPAHDDINACIVEINALTPDDMDYDLEMRRLIDFVQAHIRESERMLFPLIEREISPACLRPLTAGFARRSLQSQLVKRVRAIPGAPAVAVPPATRKPNRKIAAP